MARLAKMQSHPRSWMVAQLSAANHPGVVVYSSSGLQGLGRVRLQCSGIPGHLRGFTLSEGGVGSLICRGSQCCMESAALVAQIEYMSQACREIIRLNPGLVRLFQLACITLLMEARQKSKQSQQHDQHSVSSIKRHSAHSSCFGRFILLLSPSLRA